MSRESYGAMGHEIFDGFDPEHPWDEAMDRMHQHFEAVDDEPAEEGKERSKPWTQTVDWKEFDLDIAPEPNPKDHGFDGSLPM
jgi:hypothetical protein